MEREEKERVVGEIQEQIHELNRQLYEIWKEHTFLHWDFWFSWALCIIPWVIWWKFRKKDSTARLMLAGSWVLIIASYFDFIGVTAGKWYYIGKAVPSIPTYAPWDFTLLPVLAMALLQYKPKVSPYLKALVFGGFTAFIGEPFFVWAKFYVPVEWKYIYSFPIYMAIYLLAHWISQRNTFVKL